MRAGESSRRNWYVRIGGYANTVSPLKMGGFRRNYLYHGSSKSFIVEQAKGYVNALEKSTSPVLGLREVFEHCAQKD
jgi:hypothetical protein